MIIVHVMGACGTSRMNNSSGLAQLNNIFQPETLGDYAASHSLISIVSCVRGAVTTDCSVSRLPWLWGLTVNVKWSALGGFLENPSLSSTMPSPHIHLLRNVDLWMALASKVSVGLRVGLEEGKEGCLRTISLNKAIVVPRFALKSS